MRHLDDLLPCNFVLILSYLIPISSISRMKNDFSLPACDSNKSLFSVCLCMNSVIILTSRTRKVYSYFISLKRVIKNQSKMTHGHEITWCTYVFHVLLSLSTIEQQMKISNKTSRAPQNDVKKNEKTVQIGSLLGTDRFRKKVKPCSLMLGNIT